MRQHPVRAEGHGLRRSLLYGPGGGGARFTFCTLLRVAVLSGRFLARFLAGTQLGDIRRLRDARCCLRRVGTLISPRHLLGHDAIDGRVKLTALLRKVRSVASCTIAVPATASVSNAAEPIIAKATDLTHANQNARGSPPFRTSIAEPNEAATAQISLQLHDMLAMPPFSAVRIDQVFFAS